MTLFRQKRFHTAPWHSFWAVGFLGLASETVPTGRGSVTPSKNFRPGNGYKTYLQKNAFSQVSVLAQAFASPCLSKLRRPNVYETHLLKYGSLRRQSCFKPLYRHFPKFGVLNQRTAGSKDFDGSVDVARIPLPP